MVRLLQLINHVGNGFDISRMDFNWRQASLWTKPKKFEDKELEALLEEDQSQMQEELAESLGVTQQAISVRSHESHGNNSKTRKLSALWTEIGRRWKEIFHLRTDSKTTEKRFFASDCDWRWDGYSTITPRRKNTMLSPINRCHRPQHQHYGRTFMLRRSCSVSGLKRSCLLWAAETWQFHYGRSVSTIIDSFALREKRLEYEQRHAKVILLHDNARPHVAKVVKKYLETLKWDILSHPPYFSGHCSFWLLVIPKAAASHRFISFAEIENWLQNFGSPPKTSHFFEIEFENCLRDGKK